MSLAIYLKNYTSDLTNDVNIQFKKLQELQQQAKTS